MTKAELVASVAEKTGLAKKIAERAVVAVLDSIKEGLAGGETVQVSGFGSFQVRERAGRVGRNPKTGEAIPVPGGRSPVFKPGKGLKEAVR